MKSHLHKVSQEHADLSKAVLDAATRVAEFKEAQKKDFKKVPKFIFIIIYILYLYLIFICHISFYCIYRHYMSQPQTTFQFIM